MSKRSVSYSSRALRPVPTVNVVGRSGAGTPPDPVEAPMLSGRS